VLYDYTAHALVPYSSAQRAAGKTRLRALGLLGATGLSVAFDSTYSTDADTDRLAGRPCWLGLTDQSLTWLRLGSLFRACVQWSLDCRKHVLRPAENT
jgi:hypothetical protein